MRVSYVLLCVFGVVGAGCDSTPAAPADSGVQDTGAQAETSVEDTGRPDTRDGGVADTGVIDMDAMMMMMGDGGFRFTECDPLTLGSCGAGRRCAAAYELVGTDRVQLHGFVCVQARPTMDRQEGVPCSPVTVILDAGTFPDGNVFRADPCADGLTCIGTSGECRRQCDPRMGSGAEQCATDRLCFGIGGFPFGQCDEPITCDPVYQRECNTAIAGCYVLPNKEGDGLSTCFLTTTPADAGADAQPGLPTGAPCRFSNDCRAGAQCVGVPDGDGGITDNRCRPFCNDTLLDGGTINRDAGPDGAPFAPVGCAASTACVPYREADLSEHPFAPIGSCY